MYKIIRYKKISVKDKEQVEHLLKQVTDGLERKDFFISISNDEFSEFFDEEKGILYGAYDNDKLVGMGKLDFLDKYLNEYIDIANLKDYKVAKLGKYLVLERYRNNGIMYNLHEFLTREAKKLKFNYIITIAHPENMPSNRVLKKSGMKLIKTTILKNGNNRHIYVKKI